MREGGREERRREGGRGGEREREREGGREGERGRGRRRIHPILTRNIRHNIVLHEHKCSRNAVYEAFVTAP